MSAELTVLAIYGALGLVLVAALAVAAALRRQRRRLSNGLLVGWVCALGAAGYGAWRVDGEPSESATALMWFFFYTPLLALVAFVVGAGAYVMVARRRER